MWNARHGLVVLVAGTVLFWVSGVAGAVNLADKCLMKKLEEAGKYNFCRMKAQAKAVKKGTEPDFTKCDLNLAKKWEKAEAQAAKKGVVCPTTDEIEAIKDQVIRDSEAVTRALMGIEIELCGNGVKNDSEQCDGDDLGGATCVSLGHASGTLLCTMDCAYDTEGCTKSAFPASGQQTVYVAGGDGDVRAGAPLQYLDNGDGTIMDLNTGLMWEKKSNDRGLHDKDVLLVWEARGTIDGVVNPMETIWEWLDEVNAEGGTGFAGYDDWRIPNAKELQSIADYERIPAVDPIFNDGDCVTGCTVTECSCTAGSYYWSSTTAAAISLPSAWAVAPDGGVVNRYKSFSGFVRAVRGGER